MASRKEAYRRTAGVSHIFLHLCRSVRYALQGRTAQAPTKAAVGGTPQYNKRAFRIFFSFPDVFGSGCRALPKCFREASEINSGNADILSQSQEWRTCLWLRFPDRLRSLFAFVARAGFEPTQAEPKSAVLPLDDRAKAGANVENYSEMRNSISSSRPLRTFLTVIR